MESTSDFDGPVSLEFRVKHYEERSKAQAVRIVELEAKVAYLEKCLEEGRAKSAYDASNGHSEPSTNITCARSRQAVGTSSGVVSRS